MCRSAPEALTEAREVIGGLYLAAPYVPEAPRHYRTKAKNAQEAHEAIRPTSLGRQPWLATAGARSRPALRSSIWKRMIASQMEAARIERTTIDLDSADGQEGLRATGQVIQFDGYLKVYEEGRDDPEASAAGADAEGQDFRRTPAGGERGRGGAGAEGPRRSALHRAPAPLFGSLAGGEDGGAGHRPALDLRLDPHRAARPLLWCGWTRTGSFPRTSRPPGHRLPRTVLPPVCRIRLHRRPGREARSGLRW